MFLTDQLLLQHEEIRSIFRVTPIVGKSDHSPVRLFCTTDRKSGSTSRRFSIDFVVRFQDRNTKLNRSMGGHLC